MDEDRALTSKETIMLLAVEHNITSMYKMAQFLSDEDVTVQIGQIKRWMNGASMSGMLAAKIYERFNITVTDTRGKERSFSEACKRGIANLKSRGEL